MPTIEPSRHDQDILRGGWPLRSGGVGSTQVWGRGSARESDTLTFSVGHERLRQLELRARLPDEARGVPKTPACASGGRPVPEEPGERGTLESAWQNDNELARRASCALAARECPMLQNLRAPAISLSVHSAAGAG